MVFLDDEPLQKNNLNLQLQKKVFCLSCSFLVRQMSTSVIDVMLSFCFLGECVGVIEISI